MASPENISPDVAIIGCGAAGIAAAAGAAKRGATVFVAEQNTFCGGKATAAYVGTVCGMFYTGGTNNSFAVNGFPKEFCEELMHLSKSEVIHQHDGLRFFPYDRDAFISVGDQYLKKYSRKYLSGYRITDVKVYSDKISSLTFEGANGSVHLQPKTIIDATGSSTVASMARIPFIKSDNDQAAALVIGLSGIEDVSQDVMKMSLLRILKLGVESGSISVDQSRVSLVPGSFRDGKAYFKFSYPFPVKHDKASIQQMEKYCRDSVSSITELMSSGDGIFKTAKLLFIAPETGIRTGPRNKGKYILTENDVLSCRTFDDGIGRGTWPVEFWEPGKSVQMKYFKDNGFYEIPARCLTSGELENLYFAGRGISADDGAIASARVIGTCLQTGFAAGVMAADSCQGKNTSESLSFIRQQLFSE
jgi:hypothetical protein